MELCPGVVTIDTKTSNIPNDFLNNVNIQTDLCNTIRNIEHELNVNKNVQNVYESFKRLVYKEMKNTLPMLNSQQRQELPKQSKYKPYWNETLDSQWNKACTAEKTMVKF